MPFPFDFEDVVTLPDPLEFEEKFAVRDVADDVEVRAIEDAGDPVEAGQTGAVDAAGVPEDSRDVNVDRGSFDTRDTDDAEVLSEHRVAREADVTVEHGEASDAGRSGK